MKNTTKLKHILQLYTVVLDMDSDDFIQLTLVNKTTLREEVFIDKAYSAVIRKAYSYFLKELKKQELSN